MGDWQFESRLPTSESDAGEKDRTAHEETGFQDGWGNAPDQFMAAAKAM
jgi:hypothetical protein